MRMAAKMSAMTETRGFVSTANVVRRRQKPRRFV